MREVRLWWLAGCVLSGVVVGAVLRLAGVPIGVRQAVVTVVLLAEASVFLLHLRRTGHLHAYDAAADDAALKRVRVACGMSVVDGLKAENALSAGRTDLDPRWYPYLQVLAQRQLAWDGAAPRYTRRALLPLSAAYASLAALAAVVPFHVSPVQVFVNLVLPVVFTLAGRRSAAARRARLLDVLARTAPVA